MADVEESHIDDDAQKISKKMPMVYVRGDQIILISPITLKTSLWYICV